MFGLGSKDHPAIKDVPIGLDAKGTRSEFDSMGTIEVPADKYYGAQTARSLVDLFLDRRRYHAQAGLSRLRSSSRRPVPSSIRRRVTSAGLEGQRPSFSAADEAISGQIGRAFPALRLANRLRHAEQHEHQRGARPTGPSNCSAANWARRCRSAPNDDVNYGDRAVQRHLSNGDAYRGRRRRSTASAAAEAGCPGGRDRGQGGRTGMDVVKIGRTHLRGRDPAHRWAGMVGLRRANPRLHGGQSRQSRAGLYELAVGGTAVGTGLNAPEGLQRPRRGKDCGTDAASPSLPRRTSSWRRARWTRWCGRMPPCAGWPWR